ncbi:type III PLP-dependent enzyme [Aminomonas paucivorans]|uniref:ornithine decarboxylase n=1 Tax=Aminomonas paucivorans DSM 12260 TaxID=584708 RepID=E3CWU6_9BACT|nr:type III PLP-dependent enzyme [Aminomonas paucivorans]EFQ23396.1 ornithine decarboxylase [Aminomonas paucivorans DSM 12260]
MKTPIYAFDLDRYYDTRRFEALKAFAATKQTPFLLIDLGRIAERYDELVREMSFARPFYAVKANPHESILKLLAARGSSFDVASVYELDQMLALGVEPERISYGNTIKKARDIAYAYHKGIRLFATDSESDLRKIAENAPGSKVFYRILSDCSGADWPLSRKFGTHPDSIYRLIGLSTRLPVQPYGVSFHVGSQQRDIGQWGYLISTCRYLFDSAREFNVELKMINLGGGLPAQYFDPTPPIALYASEIRRFLEEDFGKDLPEIFIEPGRGMVGDAGILVTEVVLISKKSQVNPYSWVYLDTGKFGGLIETLDEAIKYPVYVDKKGPSQKVILAGPTCDSVDVLYEQFKYELPVTLAEGDRVYFLSTGAYTASYCSVNFNGFPPLTTHIFED